MLPDEVQKRMFGRAARRARLALAAGLCIAALASGTHATAVPQEVTSCSTTVCATAGARVWITCTRPDAKTVDCQGFASIWGIGRGNAPGIAGTVESRAEARCGGRCSSNQLHTGTAAWNGLTTTQGRTEKLVVFPSVRLSNSSRECMLYTVLGLSTATARGVSPVRLALDDVEARNSDYLEVFACNTV